MQIGYKLIAEAYSPQEMVRQTVQAEQAGFDFVEISDHYHPWLYSQQHSGFAWSMLAAAAAKTERIGLATGVTCPTMRYHPAIIAQAAATTALLSQGRFVLGVGSGERLNEHIIGQGWPSITVRQAMLREALEIIKQLWTGGYQTYSGTYYQLDDARVFDLPETRPEIVVAVGGERACRLAADLGDGLFATEPKPELIESFHQAGGSGPLYVEVPLSWAPTTEAAVESAHRLFRFGATGWKILSELPNPINFEAATAFVRPDDIAESFGCGPEAAAHLKVVQQFADAGFDHLALVNAGPDPDGFFDFFAHELAGPLRAIGS